MTWMDMISACLPIQMLLYSTLHDGFLNATFLIFPCIKKIKKNKKKSKKNLSKKYKKMYGKGKLKTQKGNLHKRRAKNKV